MATAAVHQPSSPGRDEYDRARRSQLRKWDKISRKGVDSFLKNRPDDFWRRVERGIPEEHRWAVWKSRLLPANSVTNAREAKEREALFSGASSNFVAGVLGRETAWAKQIRRDALRTFPELPDFAEEYKDSLCRVLNAYAFLNPEVGYVQGMGFVGGLLLLASERSEHDTLFVFMRLMEDCGLNGFYLEDSPLLEQYVHIFDQLMDEVMPDLSRHFKNEGVQTTDYLHKWLMSLFVYCLPLPTVLLVWDTVMCNGLPHLVLAAIALLSSIKEVLLAKRHEEIIQFFTSMKHAEDELTALEVGRFISHRIGRLSKDPRVQSWLGTAPKVAAECTPLDEVIRSAGLDEKKQETPATCFFPKQTKSISFATSVKPVSPRRGRRVSFNLDGTNFDTGNYDQFSWYQQ
jgi:hypothetical protein